MISPEVKAQIIRYCQRMDAKGWVANHDGNITVKNGGRGAVREIAELILKSQDKWQEAIAPYDV